MNTDYEAQFMRGTTPSLDALAGWEWRGLNTPPWFRLLGIKKFIKGFYRDGGQLWGYNCPVEQNGMREPWIARPCWLSRFCARWATYDGMVALISSASSTNRNG